MSNYTCLQCNTLFSGRNDSNNKFCSKSCNAKYHNHLRKHTPKPLSNCCLECGSLIKNHLKFCNRSCSATYNNKLRPAGHSSRITPNSNRGKRQTIVLPDNTVINTKQYSKVSWCKVCGSLIKNSHRKTCSEECLHQKFRSGGTKSASIQVKRSKDEIALFNLCNSYFNSVRNNEQLINGWDADIIIDDIKTAILWNGPWHYKQMPHKNHSLSQVQNRDKLKCRELTNAGWNVLVFEDRHYTPETAFEMVVFHHTRPR